MLFNTLTFAIFMAAFLSLYASTQGRVRLGLIVLGSYIFYGWWDWRFLSLIMFSTGVDFMVAQRLDRSSDERLRQRLLITSLIVNLGLLATFKYLGFFVDSLVSSLEMLGVSSNLTSLQIILPVGISFYTFQTMSYTIDVYRRRMAVEHSFLRFAAYVAFFPQLVAGPIVRASHLLPQFAHDKPLIWANIVRGMEMILWGLFLKCVMADSLAGVVDFAFSSSEVAAPSSLLVGIVFYAFQIYGDFCGYSLIAIGLGRVLGFDLGINFDRPYFSTSFSEFWQRWHISLSSWLRDYLYISLGGNRHGTYKTQRNLVLTMLLGGLWHGAAWTFVAWGALHGTYLIIQRLLGPGYRRLVTNLGVPNTLDRIFLITLVFSGTCVAWVFFRADSFGTAFTYLRRLWTMDVLNFGSAPMKFQIAKGAALILFVVVLEALSFRMRLSGAIRRYRIVHLAAGCVLVWCMALLGTYGGDAFIYFQF